MRRRLAFQLTVRGTEPEDGGADREGESKPERLVERERRGGGGHWQAYWYRPAGICFLRGITSGRETNPTATEKKILSAFFCLKRRGESVDYNRLWFTSY